MQDTRTSSTGNKKVYLIAKKKGSKFQVSSCSDPSDSMHPAYCIQLSLIQRIKGGEREKRSTEHEPNKKKRKVGRT